MVNKIFKIASFAFFTTIAFSLYGCKVMPTSIVEINDADTTTAGNEAPNYQPIEFTMNRASPAQRAAEVSKWFARYGRYGVALFKHGYLDRSWAASQFKPLIIYTSGNAGNRVVAPTLPHGLKNNTSGIVANWCNAKFYKHEWCSGTALQINAGGKYTMMDVMASGWNDNIESCEFTWATW